ncbi:hypothetical protein BDR04DRAFT_1118939 [Suillus decipiens]|nr:hypothetical protein BDR04DRAFT_1118939 [Suillus decipiens]
MTDDYGYYLRLVLVARIMFSVTQEEDLLPTGSHDEYRERLSLEVRREQGFARYGVRQQRIEFDSRMQFGHGIHHNVEAKFPRQMNFKKNLKETWIGRELFEPKLVEKGSIVNERVEAEQDTEYHQGAKKLRQSQITSNKLFLINDLEILNILGERDQFISAAIKLSTVPTLTMEENKEKECRLKSG